MSASRSSWEDSHVTHAGISLESLRGQAVSGLLDYSRPLDEAELLQLASVSGSGSTPLGRWFVCLAVLTLAVTCTGWRGLGSRAEQSKPNQGQEEESVALRYFQDRENEITNEFSEGSLEGFSLGSFC